MTGLSPRVHGACRSTARRALGEEAGDEGALPGFRGDEGSIIMPAVVAIATEMRSRLARKL